MFVRTKKIKGGEYAYLVENEWTPWGSRQKVTKYLGKVTKPERVKDDTLELPDGYKEAVKKAVEQELFNHGFAEKEGKFVNAETELDLDSIKDKKTIAMNEGYFCRQTMNSLLNFVPEANPEKTATKLATLALEAGLKLSQEQILKLYEEANKFKQKTENE